MQIYRLEGAELPRLVFEHRQPSGVHALFACDRWIDRGELHVTITTHLEDGDGAEDRFVPRPYRLRPVDGGWRWDVEPRYLIRNHQR